MSCGYKQAFDQFTQVLREKYPGVEVEGANYPPGALKSILAQVCHSILHSAFGRTMEAFQVISFTKIAMIVAIVLGKGE